MREIITIDPNSIEYKDAMQLHTRILTSGTIAANALVEMCFSLKQMRDKKQYTYLGYQSFDDYVSIAVNMKARQAYTYISTIERLGEDFLQSNASMGITKLEMLASVSEEAREDLIENNDVAEMSTRELKAVTDELNKAREQISLLEETAKKNKMLESAKEDPDMQKVDWDDIAAKKDKAVADAIAATTKEFKEKLKTEKEKVTESLRNEAGEQIRKAREEGIEAGRSAAQKGLEAVEREKAEALARSADLEKKLSVASNEEAVLFAHLFSELQSDFNKLIECARKISEKDPEAGKKYIGAITKVVTEIMPGLIPEVTP